VQVSDVAAEGGEHAEHTATHRAGETALRNELHVVCSGVVITYVHEVWRLSLVGRVDICRWCCAGKAKSW
jgi:hypothetical protein